MGYWIKQATKWYYSAVGVLRPRSTSDRTVLGATDHGNGLLVVDGGSNTAGAVEVRGRSIFYGERIQLSCTFDTTVPVHIVIQESGAPHLTCVGTVSSTASAVGMYMKNNHLVFAFTCGANGENRYLSIQLDGVTCVWTTTTTGPL